jgi:alpha-tubulin suppressor-like RCC1 family protein
MSMGKSDKGLLGQGSTVDISDKFEKLDYDYKQVKFADVSLLYDHAIALTDSGLVYGWGSNASL